MLKLNYRKLPNLNFEFSSLYLYGNTAIKYIKIIISGNFWFNNFNIYF